MLVLLARDRLLVQCPKLRELHCPLASQFLKYSFRAEPRVLVDRVASTRARETVHTDGRTQVGVRARVVW
jgi:hypothetical protein